MADVIAGLGQYCARCDSPITPGSKIARFHGSWIHPLCAPGADDE